MAPPITTATKIQSVKEIATSIPIPTHNNSTKNDCLNLITQTLQQTMQALATLVQQISYINISEPTPELPTNSKNKNKSAANVNKSKVRKAILALLDEYIDEDD
ncbi:hypothetical protein TNCV_1191191 [Trichonephila clavipes]|nr:hypothetical protein TNCV_1191191 [Trichonephila clavipes]